MNPPKEDSESKKLIDGDLVITGKDIGTSVAFTADAFTADYDTKFIGAGTDHRYYYDYTVSHGFYHETWSLHKN